VWPSFSVFSLSSCRENLDINFDIGKFEFLGVVITVLSFIFLKKIFALLLQVGKTVRRERHMQVCTDIPTFGLSALTISYMIEVYMFIQ